MPSSRSQHDPFTTTSNAAGPSLRTNASAASTRTRQQLFAPSLSRRPTTSRTTPRVEDDVLPDSDSEQENVTTPRQRQPVRRLRHASPGDRHGRFKPKQQPQAQAEELEIVNRQPDGSYLLGGSTMGVLAAPTVFGQDVAEASDVTDAAIARRYFAGGHHQEPRRRTNADEEFDQVRPEIQLRLREQVLSRLEDSKWMYEPVDRFQSSGAS